MAKNSDMRLKRLEMAMTPSQEAIAYVLSLLERFNSALECSIWCLEDPAGASANDELIEKVQHNVLRALKDQRPDENEINKAVIEAYWDVAWRLKMLVTINESVEGKVKDTLPLYFWLLGRMQYKIRASFGEELLHRWLILPKGVPGRISAKSVPFSINKEVRLGSGRQHEEWKQEVRRLLKTLYALRIAHDQMVTEGFEGHPILWKDTGEALADRTRDAEKLLGTYTNAVTIQRECLKKDVPFNLEIWAMDSKWLGHVRREVQINLDEIRQEARSVASEYVAHWADIAGAQVLASNGDPSGVIRLMKRSAETTKARDLKSGNPDLGGCDRSK